MPLERAISEHRFAYSAQASTTKMEPPPGAPLLTDFPSYIGQAFENAFGRAGEPYGPAASDWISLLNALEGELVECAADSSHQHVKGKPCPWCRMEQSSPGFVAFNSNKAATVIPTHIDVSQVAAIINAIQDPGPSPNLQTVIVVPTNLEPRNTNKRVDVELEDQSLCRYRGFCSGSYFDIFWRRQLRYRD